MRGVTGYGARDQSPPYPIEGSQAASVCPLCQAAPIFSK
jgi:hypothetical protein